MKNKKGFTLVELLAVIAILAILVIIALPNVLKMFNSAKQSTFETEVKEIARTAEKEWLKDSITSSGSRVYTKCSEGTCTNPLDMNSSDDLEYYVHMDSSGKIDLMYVKDNSFQYGLNGEFNVNDVNGVERVSDVSDDRKIEIVDDKVLVGGSEVTIASSDGSENIIPVDPYITFVNRQNANEITVEDEVAIGSEHFYVLETNSSKTTLLSKYNLYVGGSVTKRCTAADCGTSSLSYSEISTSDSKYGLQSNIANAYNYIPYPANHGSMMGKTSTSYGFVAFSGTNYWDNSVCQSSSNPSFITPYECTGTAGLANEYSNSSNEAGKRYYQSVYPTVYNSTMSASSPSIFSVNSCTNAGATGCGYANYVVSNGYTIAYYVEEYIARLKSLGASSYIIGRLLSYEEASGLSSTIKGSQSYWCGSAQNDTRVYNVVNGKNITSILFIQPNSGVRPVIVVNTSDII